MVKINNLTRFLKTGQLKIPLPQLRLPRFEAGTGNRLFSLLIRSQHANFYIP